VRGDVYRLRADRNTSGHEQRGPRYAVLVQSDALPLSTVIVAPTSTSARASTFRPEIDMNGTKTRVLVEQIRAVDPDRLGDFAGRLDPEELHLIDRALAGVLGLL
jgi:mRNA interferase MazF